MSNRILNTFSEYINWLVINYQSISKINSTVTALKLISVVRAENNEDIKLFVQVSGKNIFPKLSLQDIVNDPSILNCFPEVDRAVIQRLLPKSMHQATHRIVARSYNNKNDQVIYTIEYIDINKEKKRIYVHDVHKLAKHLHLFDREDAFLIGMEVSKY